MHSLDYDSDRANLITFMKSQSQFKDWDFDGSNLSQLINLLAYNTYNDSVYKNMVINESFLDSAVTKDSVISRAKELNYIPRSARSSTALIDITIYPNDTPAFITIPRGTQFSSAVDSTVYTFTTNDDILIYPINSTYSATNVPIYEGSYVQETFLVNTSDPDQKFILSNPNIDTSSLQVKVADASNLTSPITYIYADTLLNLSSSDYVYFLQASSNDQYQILFGNGTTGFKPTNGSLVAVSYRKCAGTVSNGAATFNALSNLGGYSSFSVAASLDSNSKSIRSFGGTDSEAIDSIKFNAPRHYQTQYRAVTAQDYTSILKENFPEILAINVYGGENASPPQYGRTLISIDTGNSDGVLSNIFKSKITNFLSKRNLPIISPTVISPDYTYITADINVTYSLSQTRNSASAIQSNILSAVQTYASATFNDFNLNFRYSKFLPIIDAAETALVDTNTVVSISKRFIPVSTTTQYAFNLQNAISPKSLSSSAFIYTNLACSLVDDGNGSVNVVSNGSVIVNNIGTINYATGVITLNSFLQDSYNGNPIKIYAYTLSQDFSVAFNTILKLDIADISVVVVPD